MISASTPKVHTYISDPLEMIPRIVTKLHTWWLTAFYPFANNGGNLSIHYSCRIDRQRASQIKLGRSVCLGKDTWLNIVSGDCHGIKLSIGENCTIGARSVISAKNSVLIENDVITATSVLIQDHNHAYEDMNRPVRLQGVTSGGRIRIESGCWIGHGAAIVCSSGDLVVGRNSVLGANCVLTRSVPPGSVVMGNPGRVVKQFDLARNRWVLGEVRERMLALATQRQ